MQSTLPSILQMVQGVFPFSDLDHPTLLKIAQYLDKKTVAPDGVIFQQGQEAGALYFILVGEVELTRTDKNGKRTLAYLKAGDRFGEDALTGTHRAQTKALAKSRTLLVRIRRENIAKVAEVSPVLQRLFVLLRRSYQLQVRLTLPWHHPAETLYLITRRHPFFLWSRVVPILLVTLAGAGGLSALAMSAKGGAVFWLILVVLIALAGGLICAWAAMEWSNDYFVLTRDRVLMQRLMVGFFDSRSETPMTAILSTGKDATFFGRIIGFGVVTARAYTGDLRLKQLPDPDLVLALLEHRRKSLLAEQRREEQAAMHSMLQKRIDPETAHMSPPGPVFRDQKVPVNYYTGTFSDLVAKFFGLRKEKEGAITFRSHWWILLKRTALPFLFVLFVVGVVIARFAGVFAMNVSLVVFAAIVLLVFGLCWWLYNFVDWKNDVYIIDGDQLIDVNRRPLGSEDKRSAPVKNIQTVEYSRVGIIALALNFGTVRIQIGNEELTFDNVYKPSQVQIEIFNHLYEFNEHMKKFERKRMVDWISTYDEIRHGEDEKPDDVVKPEKE
jgi:hypothetical protein